LKGENEMSFNARNSDPATSHNAATYDTAKRQDRKTVWELFLQCSPMSDWQLEQRLGGAMNGKWRKRRSDLSRDGLLVPVLDANGNVVTTTSPATRKKQILWMIWKIFRTTQQPEQSDLFNKGTEP